jgi:superfamily I DNA and/or RNA helicase
MKIRGKPIDEVIKFSEVDAAEENHLYPNTNGKEVEFIISELHSLYESGIEVSVGIITPHTNQQKLLVEMISKTPEWEYYLNKLQLKIMTFDTCQGEERDIVYYSMVASPHSDKLWGVFIKDLAKVDIEEDGQIKAQRLNVGFSRAKERIHFVLSKPIEDFSLISGYGRFCNDCKGAKVTTKRSATEIRNILTSSTSSCPKCSSRMVLRNGPRGGFYGCSKFPYCLGTLSGGSNWPVGCLRNRR